MAPTPIPLASSPLATLMGGGAILLWSALALLTTGAAGIPPFQLTAITFTIAFLAALAKWYWLDRPRAWPWRLPALVWLVGVGGLFGNHVFYFAALSLAPPVEANLLNYLWPLLIVLLSSLLPGERLRWFHLIGCLMGLIGSVLILGGDQATFSRDHLLGYGAALGAALVWSSYSVASRRLRQMPTEAIGLFCGAVALLSFASHGLFESWVTPQIGQWPILLAMGLGPVGAAFFLWDIGMKRGDIRALGTLAYATPLLSTLLLLAFGRGEGRADLWLALILIIGGALLGSGEILRFRKGAPLVPPRAAP